MTAKLALLFTIASLATTNAQSDAKLESLKKKRVKAIAEAIKPIDEKYREALEALLKEATKNKDYTTAKKILGELDSKVKIGNEPLSRRLIGTKWAWPDPAFKEKDAWFQLHADGSTSAGWHKRRGTWKQIDGDTVVINVSGRPVDIKLRFHLALIFAWNTDRPQQLFRQLTSD